jgi:ubiquinone/menaquinone biosynthesis C-methylase UbiE
MDSQNEYEALRRQYETDDNLRTRQETHDKYTIPNRNYVDWVLKCARWRGDEHVLDVGSGPGLYYHSLRDLIPQGRYIGVDLIPGMLRNHPAGLDKISVADALHLPFPDASFDVVMANHMLYHVQAVEDTIAELRRVLKADGLLVTATNSVGTMPELQVLMRRAIVLLTRRGPTSVRVPSLPSDRFALENGTRMLSRYFFAVVRHDLPSALVFPEVEPALTYLESTRDLREAQLPDDVVWEDVMMIMRQQINQLIKHLGELMITKQAGVLIASNSGGFIAEYLAHQQQFEQG